MHEEKLDLTRAEWEEVYKEMEGEKVTGTLVFELPKHKVGTTFLYQPGGKQKHEATVIGYLVVHETDSGYTNVTYRILYHYLGQEILTSVPRSTVDRALLQMQDS